MNDFDAITAPVRRELALFRNKLARSVRGVSPSFAGPMRPIRYFFDKPGKFLRPVLVLLSAGAVSRRRRGGTGEILALASAVEFVHAASLLHDDILDGSRLRRGRPTVNRKFGAKAAVLAGDLLYINALKESTRKLPREVVDTLLGCVEAMCAAEAENFASRRASDYFKQVENKTARLMSACCGCAAILASAGPSAVRALFRFGLRFGMAYQFMDDSIDGDSPFPPARLRDEAVRSVKGALKALSGIPDGPCKRALAGFGELILTLRSN